MDETFALEMPKGAWPISVQHQFDEPYLWAIVDSSAEKEWRSFAWVGTGHDVVHPPQWFRGTLQFRGGALVLHLFETSAGAAEKNRVRFDVDGGARQRRV
jgi:hypothetical protein